MIPVKPQVVIGYGHRLEGDLFCIFEKGIRPPDGFEPVHFQQPEGRNSQLEIFQKKLSGCPDPATGLLRMKSGPSAACC